MTRPLWLGLAMAAIGLWVSAGGARADSTLWYNGDFNVNNMNIPPNALVNELTVGSPSTYSAVYADFIVPAGQTWSISSVFSNNVMTTSVTTAYWEIRSGVMSGVGGNLLYSGTDSASQSATGRNGFGLQEYTIAVSGLTGITLSGGAAGTTYWLSVIPIDSADGSSYITNTDGTNSINVQPGTSDMSFFTSTDPNVGVTYFEPVTNNLIPSPANFSMGVDGIIVSSVPEPSTLVLALVGTLTVFGAARLRRRRTRVG